MTPETKAKLIQQELSKCRHFNGTQNTHCKAGINYRELAGMPKLGWGTRLPCLTDPFMSPTRVPCTLLSFPTEAEAEANIQQLEDHIAKHVERLSRGECPVCGKKITKRQVGRCIYGSCGHRLGQGKLSNG